MVESARYTTARQYEEAGHDYLTTAVSLRTATLNLLLSTIGQDGISNAPLGSLLVIQAAAPIPDLYIYELKIDWSKRDEVYPFLWIKLTRNGNTFAAHYSITGRDWIFMDQANIVLPQVLNLGMSVTSHEEGALAFAEFTDLSINN